jgi:hypothetical protein
MANETAPRSTKQMDATSLYWEEIYTDAPRARFAFSPGNWRWRITRDLR